MGETKPANAKLLAKNATLVKRFQAMQTINVTKPKLLSLLQSSEKIGLKDLALTTETVLLRAESGVDEELPAITSFMISAKPQARRTMVKTFLKKKRAMLLVHQSALMKRNEAASILKDYFTEGGKMEDVADWLRVAGAVLKTGEIPPDTDGIIGDFFKKIGNGIKNAINTVGDALKSIGKSIVDTVKAIVNWTQDKINDFMEALVRAGRAIGDLLNEAWKKGVAFFQNLIEGALRAGKAIKDLINWCLTKGSSVLKAGLQKIEQFLGSFTSLLQRIVQHSLAQLRNIVRALLEMGKRVIDFIQRLERLAYNLAKEIVRELINAGRAVREVIRAMVNIARGTMRAVLDALISAGKTVVSLIKEAIGWSIQQLRNFIGALKDLGHSLLSILDSVAKFAISAIKKLMQVLMQIWTQFVQVLEAIAQKAKAVIRLLLTAIVGTIRHIRTVLSTIINNVRAAFQKGLIQGLLEIGKSALTLMKEAVKIGASAAAVLFAVLLQIFGSHRGLTNKERAEARKVFGTSVRLDWVQITKQSIPADLIMWMNKNRPFTTLYVINYKSNENLSMRTLIHEITHIWQAVHSGGVYMIEALCSQAFGKAYKVSAKDIEKAKGKLTNLEREQQARVVDLYYLCEFAGGSMPKDYAVAGLTLDLIRPLAKQVYKQPKFRRNPSIPAIPGIGINSNIILQPVRV